MKPTYTYAEFCADHQAKSHGATFWGQEDQERIGATDIDEAIEEELERRHPDPLEGEVEVWGYATRKLNAANEAKAVLERLLESWDCDYGDPDGNGTDPTPAMVAASEAFISAVIADYKVWTVEPVVRVTVDVPVWVREHCSELLEAPAKETP